MNGELRKLLRTSFALNHETGKDLVALINYCQEQGLRVPRRIRQNSFQIAERISVLEDECTRIVDGIH